MTSICPRDEAVALALRVPGWMEPDELCWLHEQAGRVPPGGCWVEIGVWMGRSFVATALGLSKGGEIIGVDHFGGSPESQRHGEAQAPGNPVRLTFGRSMDLIRELRPDLTVRCVEGDSVEVSRRLDLVRLNACFVDASHTYDAVCADLQAWGRRVRPDGLLAGHDADMVDVARALDAQAWSVDLCPGSIWRRR